MSQSRWGGFLTKQDTEQFHADTAQILDDLLANVSALCSVVYGRMTDFFALTAGFALLYTFSVSVVRRARCGLPLS